MKAFAGSCKDLYREKDKSSGTLRDYRGSSSQRYGGKLERLNSTQSKRGFSYIPWEEVRTITSVVKFRMK